MKTGTRILSLLAASALFFAALLPGIHAAGTDERQPEFMCSRIAEAEEDGQGAGACFFARLAARFRGLCGMLRLLLCRGAETEESVNGDIIQDVYTDKARYLPGEKPVLTVVLRSGEDAEAELYVRASHLEKTVCEGERTVRLTAGETVLRTALLDLPETDFTGYSVRVILRRDGTVTDRAMTAAEVASDWSRFPRYGYLTDYTAKTDEELDAVIDRLSRYHITGLFFYDVLDRHDRPLAGTVGAPDETWQTLARQTASFNTVKGFIDRGHARGMNSYLYNLLFGAYQDYREQGIDPAWGLYRDAAAAEQDYHGELPGSWETQRIYLFDPANRNWQDHYLSVTKDALDAFGYDGLQADSLGGRGTVRDAGGNEVDLAKAYVPLLNRLREELGTRVIFNPVSGYGSDEVLSGTDYDIVYEEFWPWNGGSYKDLKNEVFRLRERSKADKGIALAAYMDKNSQAEEFNPAGILLTDAVLMASGAAHLELGDTGMLKSEYYPGGTLKVSEALTKTLRNYYSFFVAYENILRDASFLPAGKKTLTGAKNISGDPKKNGVWCVGRENADGCAALNFINFTGLENLDWADENGTQAMPRTIRNIPVRQYVTKFPDSVYLASPDRGLWDMEELPFVTGADLCGRYVSFVIPELKIWDLVYLKADG